MKTRYNWNFFKRKVQKEKARGFDYEIETNEEQTEFNLYLEASPVPNLIINSLINKDLNDDNINEKLKASLKEKTFIKIDTRYYELINRALTKHIKRIAREVEKDGIKILNTYVDVAYYERIDDETDKVTIKFKGFCMGTKGGTR